ncbi:MAG TPA: hypothetical protein VF559_01065 [Caulobacteraceae bacterium]|jgi:hypothetical protein
MFMFARRTAAAPVDFTAEPQLRRFIPRQVPTSREEHARLLQIAAARRLRAAERASACRPEDAQYWKAVAPAALTKAAGLRTAFSPLPG